MRKRIPFNKSAMHANGKIWTNCKWSESNISLGIEERIKKKENKLEHP